MASITSITDIKSHPIPLGRRAKQTRNRFARLLPNGPPTSHAGEFDEKVTTWPKEDTPAEWEIAIISMAVSFYKLERDSVTWHKFCNQVRAKIFRCQYRNGMRLRVLTPFRLKKDLEIIKKTLSLPNVDMWDCIGMVTKLFRANECGIYGI